MELVRSWRRSSPLLVCILARWSRRWRPWPPELQTWNHLSLRTTRSWRMPAQNSQIVSSKFSRSLGLFLYIVLLNCPSVLALFLLLQLPEELIHISFHRFSFRFKLSYSDFKTVCEIVLSWWSTRLRCDSGCFFRFTAGMFMVSFTSPYLKRLTKKGGFFFFKSCSLDAESL